MVFSVSICIYAPAYAVAVSCTQAEVLRYTGA